MSIFLRTVHNYDMDVVSFKSGLDCSSDPSRAQQHMRDECDINVMVERFARTGSMPPPPDVPGHVDFDEIFDYQSAMNVLIEAQAGFASLPAKVRARFSNDPGEFLAFVGDDRNRTEAQALGLIPTPPPAPEPVPVPTPE